MPRLTPDARQAANVDAYKAALSMFWGNMTALEQIVEEDFPDGANETIAPTRYQVDAVRDLQLEHGFKAGDVTAVAVGGSGLYVRALLDHLDFPGTDPQVRARLEPTSALPW